MKEESIDCDPQSHMLAVADAPTGVKFTNFLANGESPLPCERLCVVWFGDLSVICAEKLVGCGPQATILCIHMYKVTN